LETLDIPWIEIGPGDRFGEKAEKQEGYISAGNNFHAVFACLVRIRPFDQLDGRKWGWVAGALLEEARERQRLFIETQHYSGELQEEPPEHRTLALRCVHDPQTFSGLRLSLLAKVCGSSIENARQAAVSYWYELHSIFPYDYELIPAQTQQDFQELAGWKILNQATEASEFANVQRFEGIVNANNERFYLLGSWKSSNYANEQIWRALAGSEKRVMLNICLRPTVLLESERFALAGIAERTEKITKEIQLSNIQIHADFAANNYAHLVEFLRKPYIAQVCLVSPGGLAEYLPRAVGFALTHTAEHEPATPGFQVVQPRGPTEIADWCSQLAWLETGNHDVWSIDERFVRIRKMVDAFEASALFNLPFPPKAGFPDVIFAID
jgi:hypothetical protein